MKIIGKGADQLLIVQMTVGELLTIAGTSKADIGDSVPVLQLAGAIKTIREHRKELTSISKRLRTYADSLDESVTRAAVPVERLDAS